MDQGEVNFQTCMHLTHAFVCVPAGPKEEFHREYYSNYHLPEDCAGEKQDPCFAGTHELPQGKEKCPCGLSSCLCPGFTAQSRWQMRSTQNAMKPTLGRNVGWPVTAEATEALKSPAGGTTEAVPSVSQAAESLKNIFMF